MGLGENGTATAQSQFSDGVDALEQVVNLALATTVMSRLEVPRLPRT